jgi:TRAP-type C4-dicarboxylate transport system permease small subunit
LAAEVFDSIATLSRRAMSAAGLCYLAITLLICFDIVARRLLGFSSGATTEMSGYLMAVGMSWGMAGALYERAHVRIDVLIQKFPLRWRTWLHFFSLSCLLVSVAFFVWGSFSIALDSWTFGSTDLSSMRIPLIVPQGLWALGFALFLMAGVAMLCRCLVLWWGQHPEQMDQMLNARNYEEEAAETLRAVGESTPHPLPQGRP